MADIDEKEWKDKQEKNIQLNKKEEKNKHEQIYKRSK